MCAKRLPLSRRDHESTRSEFASTRRVTAWHAVMEHAGGDDGTASTLLASSPAFRHGTAVERGSPEVCEEP